VPEEVKKTEIFSTELPHPKQAFTFSNTFRSEQNASQYLKETRSSEPDLLVLAVSQTSIGWFQHFCPFAVVRRLIPMLISEPIRSGSLVTTHETDAINDHIKRTQRNAET
jgi:hypothetical protein